MENKKTFGTYLQAKRKEAGLTQKSFAEKLFVTESAVSKWERGLSYPDITLIKDICETLGITEHELLTASEDTQTRKYEVQAKKYIKISKGFKYTQYAIYGIALITCFICNLAIDHKLSWFFIVLSSILLSASLTLLPALVNKNKAIITLGSSTFFLILLLFVCSIYTGGNWFLISTISVLFGICVVFLPFFLKSPTLPSYINNNKTLICFAVDSILLFLLLLIADIYTGIGAFWNISVPITAFCLVFAWVIMFVIRYIKINAYFKTSICFGILSVFMFFINSFLDTVIDGEPFKLGFNYNFSDWSDPFFDDNINAIVIFSLLTLAIIFAIVGAVYLFYSISKNKPLNNKQ